MENKKDGINKTFNTLLDSIIEVYAEDDRIVGIKFMQASIKFSDLEKKIVKKFGNNELTQEEIQTLLELYTTCNEKFSEILGE